MSAPTLRFPVDIAPSRLSLNKPSTPTHILIVAAIIPALFGLHPDWYGDSVSYANDLEHGKIWDDPGHLLWRPLGWALWQTLLLFIPDLDPIIPLQILSSLATAGLVLGSYNLTVAISFSRLSGYLVAILIASSSFSILYGASGSSYPAAAACVTWAIHFSAKQNRSAPILFAVAVLTWAPSILALPVFFIAPLLFAKPHKAHEYNLWSVFILLTLLSLSFGSVFMFTGEGSVSNWAQESSHGIPISFSMMNFAKATIGFISSFLFTDSFGTAIKALLLNDQALIQVPLRTSLVIAMSLFCLSMATAVIGLSIFKSHRKIGLLWAVAILPFAGFALLWQGSDIERFSPILALSALAIITGLSKISYTLTAILVTLLALFNLVSINPTMNERAKLPSLIGASAEQNLQPGSLLIMAGQRISPHFWAPIGYFYDISPYSISFDAQTSGSDSWANNLSKAISSTTALGAEIAILSDFKGEPTKGGIWLSERELPSPSLKEIQRYFENWQETARWSVADFTFLIVVRKK